MTKEEYAKDLKLQIYDYIEKLPSATDSNYKEKIKDIKFKYEPYKGLKK